VTHSEIHDTVVRLFESAREAKGSPYEPERILAYLTEPPAPRRRSADTFAGRRRFVRFMDSLQLEFGVCFTSQEWDRGLGLDELVDLIQKKRASPKQQARLARKRLDEARRQLIGEPVTFGVIAGIPLVLAGLVFTGLGVHVLLALLWMGIVAGVAAVNASQHRIARVLVERTARVAATPDREDADAGT
jgi:hypothetical protein